MGGFDDKHRQRRTYLITALILAAGLGSAAFVYFTAGNSSDSSMVSDFENSKRYLHELEAYGGKINVLADELSRWFNGLWHGKPLATTIACLTVFISLGYLFAARIPPAEPASDSGGEKGSQRDNEPDRP